MRRKRCEGITNAGIRCVKPSRYSIRIRTKEHYYCTQHYVDKLEKMLKGEKSRGYKIQR